MKIYLPPILDDLASLAIGRPVGRSRWHMQPPLIEQVTWRDRPGIIVSRWMRARCKRPVCPPPAVPPLAEELAGWEADLLAGRPVKS